MEVHQNTVDSSDCAVDASLTASFSALSVNRWGIGTDHGGHYLYWTNPAWTIQTSNNLGILVNRPDLTNFVPVMDAPSRQFIRLLPWERGQIILSLKGLRKI